MQWGTSLESKPEVTRKVFTYLCIGLLVSYGSLWTHILFKGDPKAFWVRVTGIGCAPPSHSSTPQLSPQSSHTLHLATPTSNLPALAELPAEANICMESLAVSISGFIACNSRITFPPLLGLLCQKKENSKSGCLGLDFAVHPDVHGFGCCRSYKRITVT